MSITRVRTGVSKNVKAKRARRDGQWYPALPPLSKMEMEAAGTKGFWFVDVSHARTRMDERGIGVLEVYSTLIAPEVVRPAPPMNGAQDPDVKLFYRGDIGVVANTSTGYLITVIDRNDKYRTEPRVANNTPAPDPPAPHITRGESMPPRMRVSTPDRLWLLTKTKTPEYREVVIDDSLAAELLERNTDNRDIRPSRITHWRRIYREGLYAPTHQGGAIDSRGILQDGQHRLLALVAEAESGNPIAVKMWFLNGAPPENFRKIDSGLNRTYRDVVGDTNLGALLRLVYVMTEREGRFGGGAVTNDDIVGLYDGDRDVFDHARGVGNAANRDIFLNKSGGGAAYYLIQRINNPALVDDFFASLESGPGAEMALRKATMSSKGPGNRSKGREHMALVFKTWNHNLLGTRPRGPLIWTKAEPMPPIMRLENGEVRNG